MPSFLDKPALSFLTTTLTPILATNIPSNKEQMHPRMATREFELTWHGSHPDDKLHVLKLGLLKYLHNRTIIASALTEVLM